ncbi:hypothetical protein BJX64DRAFT_79316 [Aspergillus heterothallicus]
MPRSEANQAKDSDRKSGSTCDNRWEEDRPMGSVGFWENFPPRDSRTLRKATKVSPESPPPLNHAVAPLPEVSTLSLLYTFITALSGWSLSIKPTKLGMR